MLPPRNGIKGLDWSKEIAVLLSVHVWADWLYELQTRGALTRE
jgi:hypothetical protein